MNQLERFSNINISEIDAENVFFSVITLCKEKGIFEKNDLIYVDTELGKMIEETARYSKKGYIKKDIAVIMLKNVFMILNSFCPLAEYRKIINAVKERKLYILWQEAVCACGRDFDRMCKNFAHLEHFYRKNKGLSAEFAINLLSDVSLESIFTYSLDRKVFTREFFAVDKRMNYRELCRRSEVLCTECGFLDGRTLDDIYPMLKDRNAVKRNDLVSYNARLIDWIVLSMLYGALTKSPGLFPPYELYSEITGELSEYSESELSDRFLSYIEIAALRYKIKICQKEESIGESILNVYASRVCCENLSVLANHLASEVVKYRENQGDVDRIVYFI